MERGRIRLLGHRIETKRWFARFEHNVRKRKRTGDYAVTAPDKKVTNASPYTFRNIEVAISHLERVLNKDGADSLLPLAYWRGRILQALATPGLTPRQKERLRRLLNYVSDGYK
jgi:hypothetical protein